MDTLILQFLCGQLQVSGGCRMDNGLFTSATFASREDLQLVNELKCCFLSALDIEGEDRCTAVRASTSRTEHDPGGSARRMVHMLNLRVIGQELQRPSWCSQRDARYAETESRCPAAAGMRERKMDGALVSRSGISADVGYESSRTNCICERDAVITQVRLSDRFILAGCLPVELAESTMMPPRVVPWPPMNLPGKQINNDISAVTQSDG